MTEDEISRLATVLAEKMAEPLAEKMAEKTQEKVLKSVYHDAGKTVIGLLKNAFWGFVLFLAAWGASSNFGGSK